MAGMLKLLDQEFKTTMINMPRALMDLVDSMQERTGKASRQTEIPRKNQKELLEITSALAEMRSASHGPAGRLDLAEKGSRSLSI